ncbi:MAG: biotin carboxylase N-terminal domain-containing protein [Planctomycetota bacterium]
MRRRINKVLIANRGEIAVRIARTLRELGIAIVAVYSEADAEALHRRVADESRCIGPAPANESYLSIDKIIEAARATGADAIHPGYGFLAENPKFVGACEEAGLVFIGPSQAPMFELGDKARARKIAEAAGVLTVPGLAEVADDDLAAAGTKIGYPVLLKPSAGGGGKGMVEVHAADEMKEKSQAARRIAKAAFDNDTLIVEKLVRPARHIEIQVFGDGQGDAVALGERECSLQRRHQKVIEECPSPVVDEAIRERMEASALSLTKSLKYAGAGTVEFLLGPKGEHYFLEMNTRLQVEHPVTEMVYGVDLVAAQIAVAEGNGIPQSLRDAKPRGHAIEARIYAEDPEAGFLPTPGPVLAVHRPEGPGIRYDGALEGEGEVGVDYDPMIAKLIAWGPDRDSARRRLLRAFGDLALLGITTNSGFLVRVLEDERFAKAKFAIDSLEGWIAEDGFFDDPNDKALLYAAAACAFGKRATRSGEGSEASMSADADVYSPFDREGPWRALQGKAD